MDTGLTPHVLGPHPGLSILRIWQGVVEVTLRLALAVSTCTWLKTSVYCSIRLQVLCICTIAVTTTVVGDESNGSPTLDGSRTAGRVVACLVSAGLVVEVVIVVLRFLNIGIINFHMKKFFIIVSYEHALCVKSLLIKPYIIADKVHMLANYMLGI